MSAPQFALRVAGLYGTLYLAIGYIVAFLPVWLDGRGLSAPEIALVLAAPQFLRVFLSPGVSMLADRSADSRRVLFSSALITVAAAAALSISSGLVAIFVCVAVAIAMTQSIMPLVEVSAIAGVRRFGLDYGRMRLWGSLTFIAAMLTGGPVIERFGSEGVLALIVAALSLLLLATLFAPSGRRGSEPVSSTGADNAAHVRPVDEEAIGEGRAAGPATQGLRISPGARSVAPWWRGLDLLLERRFLLFVAAGALLQATHAVYYAVGTLHWLKLGHSATVVGLLWSVGVIAEVALFAVSRSFLLRFGATGLMLLGGAAALLRWPLTALDPPLAYLFALQTLHALTFGATHLGAIGHLAETIDEGRSAAAQGLYTTVSGVVMGAVIWCAGLLYAQLAGGAFVIMAILAGVALVPVAKLRRSAGSE